MKVFFAFVLISASGLSYLTGRAQGYMHGMRDEKAMLVPYPTPPQSNCYVPGEAYTADMPRCVTIEDPSTQNIGTNNGEAVQVNR